MQYLIIGQFFPIKHMSNNELGVLYPVFLVNYDSNWPVLFKKEKKLLESIFRSDLRIEHIGSTAITGIHAKPTIDVLIEKPSNLNDEQIIGIMVDTGYIHMVEQKKHLMFVKGYGPNGLEKESYHIHMGPQDQDWLWDRIYFRDYLNRDRDEAMNYENLKIKLATGYRNDRDGYTEKKEHYIREITELAKKLLSQI